MANRPAPEVEITERLVHRLVAEQHPDLADLSIDVFDRGWDNTNVRLGDSLIVRLPHRQIAAALLEHEQQWLPLLAPRLPLPIPVPVRVGVPNDEFRWKWSIVPWVDGATAAESVLSNGAAQAVVLGDFFRSLHTLAPADAPLNEHRGVPLADRHGSFARHAALIDANAAAGLRSLFEQAAMVEPASETVWLHGDFHAKNVLVRDGALASVIDWGDITSGDRATDLAGAFMLVPDHIDVVKEHAGASEADWARARGWAANFAAVYLAQGDDAPIMTLIGNRLVDTLL